MLATRVIPVLLLKDGGLYKGKRFKNHQYVGDPANTVKIFNEKEVDELVLLDINATQRNQPPDFDLLSEIASEAFMPLAYGGGVNSIEQADKIFSIGFEKCIVNTAIYESSEFVRTAVKRYGSQSIVASIDYRDTLLWNMRVLSRCGAKKQALTPLQAALNAVELGIGEIILNSIDRDGTMSGYDLTTIGAITSHVDVPVIAAGGAGTISDFVHAKEAGASAVAAGAMFVYHGPHRAVLIQYPPYGELERALNSDSRTITERNQ